MPFDSSLFQDLTVMHFDVIAERSSRSTDLSISVGLNVFIRFSLFERRRLHVGIDHRFADVHLKNKEYHILLVRKL